MLLLLFLTRKPHHIASGKMARKDVKDESDYHRRGDMSIIIWQFQWFYIGSVEGSKFSLSEKIPQ